MTLFLGLLVGLSTVWASPHFTSLRDDQTVPSHCQDMELGFYSLPAEVVYVGRKGATSMGFSMEYPVSRKNATILWRYFKSLTHGSPDETVLQQILRNPELKRDYEILLRNYQEQDFDFTNEGEILEALAIHDLYNEFPENVYYITGGVMYHRADSPMTIGELDVFIGRRDSCEAVVVGETKLGTRKMLNKAKKQLSRFEDFLLDHNSAGFSGEYESTRPSKQVLN